MKHDKLVKIISQEFERLGYEVENEKLLPEGKGATDISCKKEGIYAFHAEVKETPSTINKKKIRKQLNLYKKYFGEKVDYVLISPNASGNLVFQNLSGEYSGNLNNYFSYLNH